MGNEGSLCHASRQYESTGKAETHHRVVEPDKTYPKRREKVERRTTNDLALACDCCSATQKGVGCGAGQVKSSKRGFEDQIQTPRSKVQAFRSVEVRSDSRFQVKAAPTPASEVFVSNSTLHGSSIPPLDYSLDSGSVPPSTDVDGHWIEKAPSTSQRSYAYQAV